MSESTPGAPRRATIPHAPGLDGLRGLAVAAVVVFHAAPATWLPGGFLGVSLFFTLSGYLIASLVITEVEAHGRLSLSAFWGRRVRRLVPALALTLAAVAVLARLVVLAADTRRDLFGGLTYTSNWLQIIDERPYAALFEAPSPVTHLWSLAIEEQFYVLFPLAAWLVARRAPDRIRASLAVGAVLLVLVGLAVTFAVDDPSFTYLATPTRAPEIALGVLLACLTRHPLAVASWRPTALGVLALAATVVAWRVTGVTDSWVGDGGLVAFGLVSAALVWSAGRPGPLATALGWRPLRALGVISYGLYLVHWPVVVLLDRPHVDLAPGPRFVARVVVSLAVAALSYRLVERPVRTAASGGSALLARLARPTPALGAAAASLAVVALVVATVAPTPEPAGEVAARPAPAVVRPGTPPAGGARSATGGAGADARQTGGEPAAEAAAGVAAAPGPPTVVLLGDSVPNWLVRDGGPALDPAEVTLVDGTLEGCDGAEGSPVGRAGTGTVVTVPADCTGWTSQYPPALEAGPVDVAVLMVGTGAVLDRRLDGSFRGPCDPVTRQWYGADVAARLDYLADHADRVVVVLPAWAEDWSGWVNPSDHRDRLDCVRSTLTDRAEAADDVALVDLAAHLCPDGPSGCRPVRQRDGVHVDPDQAGAVLGWVVERATAPG